MATSTAWMLTMALGATLAAQAPSPTPPKNTPPPASPVATPTATPAPEDVTKIQMVPYRPTLTRDPFSTPTDAEQGNKGELIDDIGVKGWMKAGGVLYAVVSDSRGNIKRLPVGHRFRDGEIAAIDEKSVTFRQWDVSSTNRSVYRTVVKTFKREEGKR
ncbi:MAG: hypothetical protein LWX11_07905 [Firmicutes bacterium]|nr:hypothetical protein [Bacillota bacterium]